MTKTKFSPILFSTPMVQAILENRKTMTRRTKGLDEINCNPDEWKHFHTSPDGNYFNFKHINHATMEIQDWYRSVKITYQVGDVLWVRETTCWVMRDHAHDLLEGSKDRTQFVYKANVHTDWMEYAREKYGYKWKTSLFMPKSACRIFLKIKSIKVERLQDISTDDIIKEGVQLDVFKIRKLLEKYGKDNPAFYFLPEGRVATDYEVHKLAWADLWISINEIQSWISNPFVFVYEFEQIEKPLDFIV